MDGISDQDLPTWDGGFSRSYFAALFRRAWVGSPPSHITLARYVVQWNVMSGGYGAYRLEFERWLIDVRSLDLVPDLALTSYDGVRPRSAEEYRSSLEQVLARARAMGYPVRYLEGWNEPNNQGGYGRIDEAVTPAHFTNAASAACAREAHGCAVIAGDFEDTAEVAAYEREYERNLSPIPAIWGIHPYEAVKYHDDANVLGFEAGLPAGSRIWITEVGAYRCEPYGDERGGELEQAEDARWLVHTLMPAIEPTHVFYYSFLPGGRRRPSCAGGGSDTALYVPDGEPSAPDVPRAAAAVIYDGGAFPWGYPAAVSGAIVSNSTLTEPLQIGGG